MVQLIHEAEDYHPQSSRRHSAAFSLPNYKNAYLLTLALLKRLDPGPARAGLSKWAAAAARLAIGRG